MKNFVLIPIHNAEKTLEKSIESVIIQDVDQEFEICAILNNCSDDSENLLEKIKKNSNIKINILKENEQGIVPTLNLGLKFALNSGAELIFRQDADDIWHQNKMQSQLDFLIENSNISILGTQINVCDKEQFEIGIRKEIYKHYLPTNNNDCFVWLLNGHNPIAHPSVVIKKDVFETCGLYKNYPYAEDLKLWTDAASSGFHFSNLKNCFLDYNFKHNPNYNPEITKIIKKEFINQIQNL